MRKKTNKKLPFKDHFLYSVLYIVFFILSFPLPLIVWVRDKLFLHPYSQILAYSNGFGLLWMIPSMILSFIVIGYLGYCEKKCVTVSVVTKSLFQNRKKTIIVILCFILFLSFLLLSIASGRTELTADGIVKYGVFGTRKYIIELDQVERIELQFDSLVIGLNGSTKHNEKVFDYVIYVGGNEISFDRYNLENIPDIHQLFENIPKTVNNGQYMSEWLNTLNCDENLKVSIRQIFSTIS